MSFKIKNTIIKIEWTLVIIVAISILSETFRHYMEMYYMCFLFIIFHEMAHIVTGIIFGKKIRDINLSICGISVGFKDYYYYIYQNKLIQKFKTIKQIMIFLSGPIASLILAFTFKNIKFVYEINMVFFIINLIPIYPLDGYNILKECLSILKNVKLRNLFLKLISIMFLILILSITVFISIKYKNYNCVIFMLYVLTLNLAK